MSAVANTIEGYRKAHQAMAPRMAKAAWLDAVRACALQRFLESGFPTTRDELWKYTNLRPLTRHQFVPDAAPVAGGEAVVAAQALADLDSHRLVFVNGHYAPHVSSPPDNGSALTVRSLADVLRTEPEAVNGRLAALADTERHRFSALNTAFIVDGVWIDLGVDATPERPVYLLFVSMPGSEPALGQPRVLVTAARGARLTLIEHFVGADGTANLTNAVTEVQVGAGAHVEHYKLQEEPLQGFHVGAVHASLARDARFVSHNVGLGARLARTDIDIRLEGPGAETVLNGLVFAGGAQHVDNHTRVDHIAPQTVSTENYRCVLDGRGRSVFNGKVVVHEDAQKINARQSNDNLLLSATAEADTKPELEIYADDVKCSHGATVGALDRDALFYMRSRGIGEESARALLTFAFADEVIMRLGSRPIRERLERIVLGRLPDSKSIKELV